MKLYAVGMTIVSKTEGISNVTVLIRATSASSAESQALRAAKADVKKDWIGLSVIEVPGDYSK